MVKNKCYISYDLNKQRVNRMTEHIERKPKPHVNVGTIGHIDCGKTLISSAVCGVLNSKQLTEMKRELDLIDKNATKKENK